MRLARPVGDEDFLFPCPHLDGEREIRIQHEGTAIEYKLVLPADLVQIGHRQAAFLNAPDGKLHAGVEFVEIIGRAVRHEQHFRTRFLQALHNVRVPDVFADRHPHTHAANVDRSRQRTLVEDAGLVEHAVIGQTHLVAMSLNLPLIEIEDGIVELVFFLPWRADQHGRASVRRLLGKLDDGLPRPALESGTQHKVLGRIAGNEELRKDDQIRARQFSFAAGLDRLFQIALYVAHRGVELGERNTQPVGH